MKRIAMISEHASPLGALGGVDGGGQNVYVGQLATHLGRAGYEVDVFTRRDRDDLQEIIDWRENVRIVNVPAGPAAFVRKEDLLPYMDEFAQYMQDNWRALGGYDLIHANFWTSGLVAMNLKRRFRVPFVVTFHALGRVRRRHQGEHDGFPDERFAVEDAIVASADRLIAECPQDRSDLIELYGADSHRIEVIPCGFDPDELWPEPKAAAREQIGVERDGPLVLQLGRLVPRKGIDNVIRAIARLRERHGIGARLLVVGGESDSPDPAQTPEIGRLQELANDEGVGEHVTFTGRRDRDQLKHYYSAADVFVTTPWYEPFGITPLEAMACARPVIGANVGGIKFSVEAGETGLLVQPEDPEGLADALAFLITDPAVAEGMGRRGYERVQALFTWQAIARDMAALYERVIHESDRGIDARDRQIHVVDAGFAAARETLRLSAEQLADRTVEAGALISDCLRRGGKLLICGNGGSAADSQHLAAELVGRFRDSERPALAAIALTADTAILTAWSNDTGYEQVFARQVEALGNANDVLIGISTSGRSVNVMRAFEVAKKRCVRCLALTGGSGGPLAAIADLSLIVPSEDTQRIQEVHSVLIHLLCELVEQSLSAAPAPRGLSEQLISAPRMGRPVVTRHGIPARKRRSDAVAT